jgi:hypothetical protein
MHAALFTMSSPQNTLFRDTINSIQKTKSKLCRWFMERKKSDQLGKVEATAGSARLRIPPPTTDLTAPSAFPTAVDE